MREIILMDTSNPVVGFFDSGVGGFSVVQPLLERFPNLSMIYAADTAHLPYSNKTKNQLEVLIGKVLQFFLSRKVDLVVFACNTSSALILPQARPFYPVPLVGVVEPGVEAALRDTGGKGIGVVANEVTARSGVFRRLILARKNVPVIEIGCPRLVDFVEAGDLDSAEAEKAVESYCKPLQGKIDTLIFACTHFPFLEHQFKKFLPGVKFVDPAIVLAGELSKDLQKWDMRFPPTRRLFGTKVSPHLSFWAKKVLNWEVKGEFLDLDLVDPWVPALKADC